MTGKLSLLMGGMALSGVGLKFVYC